MDVRIISFFQEGCMACHEQAPINREVEKALSLAIDEINLIKDREYIEKFNLKVTPTVVVIKEGVIVERFWGCGAPGTAGGSDKETSILDTHISA